MGMNGNDNYYLTGMGLIQYVMDAQRPGIEAEQLLRQSGLDPDVVLKPEQQIPVDAFEHFLTQLILHSGDEYLGFHIGHQVMPALYGALPALAFSASSVRVH